MSTDKEREAFEAAMGDDIRTVHWNGYRYVEKEQYAGLYSTTHVLGAWHGWQQARAALEAQPAKRGPLTDEQLASACLSYRHDFGLMNDMQRAALMAQAAQWARVFGIGAEPAQAAPQADKAGDVVVTWNESRTRIMAVTRQDEDGRVLKVIAEAPPVPQADDEALMRLALEALESSRVFVTTREKIKHPEGTNWYDESTAALRTRLGIKE